MTPEQAEAIKPHLRTAVEARIRQWRAENAIEAILDRELNNIGDEIDGLAVSYDKPSDIDTKTVELVIGEKVVRP